ncbi:MAG: HVO_0476 family zinc finger protein [Methanomassiliicoccales archaeon]
MSIEMTVPNALYVECPSCGERTLHEVLKGRLGRKQTTMEATVQCQECGHTHSTVLREEPPKQVPVVISDQGRSRKTQVEMEPEEVLAVDDELFVGDEHVMVTSIESGDGRVEEAPVEEIDTLWTKRYDRIKVKVSVNKGHKTVPSEVSAMPDEEFFVGDILSLGKEQAVIHQLKTRRGKVREGSARARNIVRIYAKAMRVTFA